MIPILFKEDETNFNSNGIGHLKETITYDVLEVRNGEFELYLEYPVTGRWFTEIKDFRLILAEPNEVDDDHLFRIYETVKSADSQTIFVYGTTKSNDLGGNLVNDVTIVNNTAQEALNKMKSAMIMASDYNFVSDITTRSSTEWLRRNPLNCIAGEEGSLVNYWGGEIKRTNDTIYLYGRRGKDKVATIRPGKNLNGFTLTSSTKGLITRILPFFTYTPEKSDKQVTITGTIVDSPLVNNYPVKYITPVDFTSDDTITTLAQLNTAATKYFATMNPGCDKPSVSIDVDLMQLSDSSEYDKFKALERIQLTDTVTVWVKKYDVDVDVKVTEITYNGMQQMVTNIVAGTSVTNLYDDVKKTYKDDISELHKYVNDMEHGVRNTIQIAADGKSTIFRGYTEPAISISKLNDLWYKQLGSGEVEIWIFDGAYWQPLVTAGLNEAVRAEVNKIIAQADVDRANAEQAYEDAIIEGGIYTDGKAAEFNGKLDVIKADLAAQVSKIDANIVKADKAISDANFAKIDATKAIGDAATALSAANTAKTNAATAITNAATALSRVGAVEVTTGNLTTSYDTLTQTVGLKADKTVVDGINSKVTTQGTQISANATAIALKVDKTVVDTLTNTVTKHTTDIKVVADGLLLKADSSTVNTLTGTVTTHTGQISANSTAIGLRLTSAQVESAITAKNYVNQTTLNATAQGLQLNITQVSNDLLNLDINGTNLFPLSSLRDAQSFNSFSASDLTATLVDGDYTVVNRTSANASRAMYSSNSRIEMLDNYIVGDVITISVDVYIESLSVNGSTVFIRFNNSSSGMVGDAVVNILTTTPKNKWVRLSGAYTIPSTADISKTDTLRIGIQGTAKIRFRNINVSKGNKDNGWSPYYGDMATLDKVVTLEANIDGINATVATKANQSQVTLLAGQLTTKVESSTYNSKMTQLDSAINLRVVQSDVTAAILADKTIKDTRNINSTPSMYWTYYPKQTVEEFKERYAIGVAGSAPYGQLTTKVPWIDSTTGVITQTFSSADGVFQRVSTTNTTWGAWDKIAEAGKLVAQINLSSEGVLIQGKRIQLDGDVAMNAAFITRLDVLTLAAVYADIATLKTKVLTADVITSTMIKSDTALITKLFVTDANVNILTAKTAFVNAIKAISITADMVTAGTLNAANVNIINLNVSKIVGLNSAFIASQWNSLSASVSIDASGIKTVATDKSETYIQNGVFGARNPAGASLGHIGYRNAGSSPFYNIKTSLGTNFSITAAIGSSSNETEVLTILPGSSETYIKTNQFRHVGTSGTPWARFSGDVTVDGKLDAINSDVIGKTFRFKYGSWIYDNSSNSQLVIVGGGGLRFYTAGASGTSNSALWIDNYYMYMTRHISMEGYNITNQSDRRLKMNINLTSINSLEAIRRWTLVDYMWRDSDRPSGTHLGLIAQDTPELLLYDVKQDIYSINSSKQTMMNTHAIQQLDQKVTIIENLMQSGITLASRALGETEILRNRVKELEEKIRVMESAA